jgi:hypothetical protein
VDQVVALISLAQHEKYDAEAKVRGHFERLYEDLRAHLVDAYKELDEMAAKMGPSNKHKLQAEKLAMELEAMRKALAAAEQESATLKKELAKELGNENELEHERDDYIATHHLSDKDVANLMHELGQKKEELAKEFEKSMQREFEITSLQEELTAVKHNLTLKDNELWVPFWHANDE